MIRRTTWILLGVLAVVVAGYLALGRLLPQSAEEATPTPQDTAWSLTGEEVDSLRVVDRSGSKVLVLVRDFEAGWRMTAPIIGPADAGRIELALASLLAPRVRQRLAAPDDPGAYGLQPPGRTVTLFLRDGTTRTLEVGDVDPTGSVIYVRRLGETEVLMLSRFSLEDVLGLLADPPVAPPTPTPSPEAVPTETP